MKSAEHRRSLRRRADNTSGDRPLVQVERARLVRVPPRVLESGTVIANRFVLQARIGSGRYGEIYRASDRSSFDAAGSSKHVALLILRESLQKTDRLRRRIEEGFTRLASWSHPNIVRILEFGRDESTFVAMELLEGESLRTILENVGRQPLELEESLAVIRDVGEALRHAHARDVVHGDIRPETVFVTFEFRVKVLDFIPVQFKRPAALADDSAAESSSKRRVHDDVYGLACLAYELLSGAHPYGGSPGAHTCLFALSSSDGKVIGQRGTVPSQIMRSSPRTASWDSPPEHGRPQRRCCPTKASGVGVEGAADEGGVVGDFGEDIAGCEPRLFR